MGAIHDWMMPRQCDVGGLMVVRRGLPAHNWPGSMQLVAPEQRGDRGPGCLGAARHVQGLKQLGRALRKRCPLPLKLGDIQRLEGGGGVGV